MLRCKLPVSRSSSAFALGTSPLEPKGAKLRDEKQKHLQFSTSPACASRLCGRRRDTPEKPTIYLDKMAAAIKALNARIRANPVSDYLCSTREFPIRKEEEEGGHMDTSWVAFVAKRRISW